MVSWLTGLDGSYDCRSNRRKYYGDIRADAKAGRVWQYSCPAWNRTRLFTSWGTPELFDIASSDSARNLKL